MRNSRDKEGFRRLVLARPAGAATLLLALDHVDDQLDHLLDPGGLRLAMLECVAPVTHVSLGRQLVEAGNRDLPSLASLEKVRFEGAVGAGELGLVDLEGQRRPNSPRYIRPGRQNLLESEGL